MAQFGAFLKLEKVAKQIPLFSNKDKILKMQNAK